MSINDQLDEAAVDLRNVKTELPQQEIKNLAPIPKLERPISPIVIIIATGIMAGIIIITFLLFQKQLPPPPSLSPKQAYPNGQMPPLGR